MARRAARGGSAAARGVARVTPVNWRDLMTGLFLVSFIVAVPLAVPLLFLIRARVRRYMRDRTRGAPAAAVAASPSPPPPVSGAAMALVARMRRARRGAALLYGLAGIAAACVPALWSGAAVPLHPLWPVLLIVATIAVPSFGTRMTALAGLYLVLAVTMPETIMKYTFVPMLLLMLAVNRWLKTISLVLALVGFAVFGAMGGAMIAKEPYGDMGWLAAFVVLAAIGLYVVHLIVRAYERKFFSDASYQFLFLWLIFAPYWVYVDRVWWPTLSALGLYAVLSRLTLPLLRRAARRHEPVSLLVLRTFGAPGRSHRLFEGVGARWRYIGPIHLIAGADSATVNLDLSEAFRYLTFRFRSLFVSDAEDLERRLTSLDCAPDPDGRYRVNDFFCFEADRRTDVEHLRATLQSLWRRLDPSLPNAQLEQPVLRILHRPRSGRLVAALCDAAVAGGWRDEPPPAPA